MVLGALCPSHRLSGRRSLPTPPKSLYNRRVRSSGCPSLCSTTDLRKMKSPQHLRSAPCRAWILGPVGTLYETDRTSHFASGERQPELLPVLSGQLQYPIGWRPAGGARLVGPCHPPKSVRRRSTVGRVPDALSASRGRPSPNISLSWAPFLIRHTEHGRIPVQKKRQRSRHTTEEPVEQERIQWACNRTGQCRARHKPEAG